MIHRQKSFALHDVNSGSDCHPEENVAKNQLLESSMSLSLLHPTKTTSCTLVRQITATKISRCFVKESEAHSQSGRDASALVEAI